MKCQVKYYFDLTHWIKRHQLTMTECIQLNNFVLNDVSVRLGN